MPQTVDDLGIKVKSKYPGQYDDLSNAEVGQRVKAKFPGAYDDFSDTPASISPTLLASRQAASKSAFDKASTSPLDEAAAHPLKTALDIPLDVGAGIERAFGVDPLHPIKSLPLAAAGFVKGLFKIGGAEGPLGQLDAAKSLIMGPVKAAQSGVKAATEGDIPSLSQAAGEVYGSVRPVISGARAVFDNLRAPKPGLQQPVPAPGVQNLVDAVDGGRKMFVEDKLRDVVNSAQYDLKAAETEHLGRPVKSLRDAATVAKYAKEQAWTPYQSLLDQTTEPILRDDLIKEAVANLPDSWDEGSRVRNRAVNEIKSTLKNGSYSVNEIEAKAQTLNAELQAFYKQNNLQRAASLKLPTTAAREATLSAYRTLQDSAVQGATGYDPAPLRARYGNLKAIEAALIDQPAPDSNLMETLTSYGHVPTPRNIAVRIAGHLLRVTPDQLAAKAFASFEPGGPLNATLPNIASQPPATSVPSKPTMDAFREYQAGK